MAQNLNMGRIMKKPKWIAHRRKVWSMVMLVSALGLAGITGCGMIEDEAAPRSGLQLDEDMEVRIQQLDSFCTVQVQGYGAVDVENDYLPSVIACENGNASMEALKAQAVAARTYAAFITATEKRPLDPTVRDQVYKCSYAQVTDRHRQAVQETAGQVLTYNDKLIATFYVAGGKPAPNSATCKAAPGQTGINNTERWVTYNQGRVGGSVIPSRLGHPANPANRGAKSQEGAKCLSDKGWDYERILRFYYGDDARTQVPAGSTCAGGSSGGGNMCNLSASSTQSTAPSCTDPSQAPQILPRSAWGARAPRANRPKHTPQRIAVHHTVTPNNAADGAYWVRQAQKWHMDDNGWSDIGYHFLIAWDGKIYRGNPEDRIGAHSGNYNTGNLGIALLGRFDTGKPSQAQLDSLARLIRYLGDKYNIPLNRDRIKGHGEQPYQSTACPGTNLKNQLNSVVENAKADSLCRGGSSEGGESADPTKPTGYRYVRVTGVSASPNANDTTVDGYEVDSIYVDKGGSSSNRHHAHRVACSPGVNNPGAAIGSPDNTSCGNRTSTVAGVPVGGELIVELQDPIKKGDTLHVIQSSYPPADASCDPTGQAKISVSEDGKVWKVLARNNSGNWSLTLQDQHFVIDENDDIGLDGEGFKILHPRAGHWYTEKVTFSAAATNPNIVRVDWLADNWSIQRKPSDQNDLGPKFAGANTNKAQNFPLTYTFDYLGERKITAVAYNASGQEVARDEVTITVTDYHGNIPKGRKVIPPLPKPDPGTGGGVGNAAAAEKLATEGGKCYHPSYGGGRARCNNGRGGSSIGYCWGYVKNAMQRAGYNVDILASAGPCSYYTFHASAYGFRCNADPNPATLARLGFERIDVEPKNAPRGAIITWDRGCNRFHAVHGHIEISQGNGIACSDYCGNIRSGGKSCSSVYIPIK